MAQRPSGAAPSGAGRAPAPAASDPLSWVPPRRGTLNFAHRGASFYAPENTIAAFDLAVQLGSDYIELDVRMTRDGRLAVFHDLTLERVARRAGEPVADAVRDRSLEEVCSYDAGTWFNEVSPLYGRPEYERLRIPSLDEVLGRYGHRVGIAIELKWAQFHAGMEEEVVRLLDHHGLCGPRRPCGVLVMSFETETLLNVRRRHPSVRLVQLLGDRDVKSAGSAHLAAIARYACAVGVHAEVTEADLVASVHDAGLRILPYHVNDSTRMLELIDMGADGIMTDVPDRLDDVLATRDQGSPIRG